MSRRGFLRLGAGAGLGSDGGLLAAPVRHEAIDIAPAERYDVVVNFAGYRPGTAVALLNRLGSRGTGQVMRFRVTGRARDDSAVPARWPRSRSGSEHTARAVEQSEA